MMKYQYFMKMAKQKTEEARKANPNAEEITTTQLLQTICDSKIQN